MLTPYKAAKRANLAIEAAGLKAIPPQMVYNYTSQRLASGKTPYIACEVVGEKVLVSEESIDEWTQAYIAKKLGVRVTSEENKVYLFAGL